MAEKTGQQILTETLRCTEIPSALCDELEGVKSIFQPNGDIIALLRLASKRLEGRRGVEYAPIRNGQMFFPSWDDSLRVNLKEAARYTSIRNAAYIILGQTGVDSGAYTEVDNVAALIHYIADMLEI